jgi:hypothetical protein
MKVHKTIESSAIDRRLSERIFSFPFGQVDCSKLLESFGADTLIIVKRIIKRPFLLNLEVEASLERGIKWKYRIGDREFSDRLSVVLIWLLSLIASSFILALWAGLTLYGFALILLFFYEPFFAGVAVFRVWYLFVALLCFLVVWAGLGGKAVVNLVRILKRQ